MPGFGDNPNTEVELTTACCTPEMIGAIARYEVDLPTAREPGRRRRSRPTVEEITADDGGGR